MNTVKFIKKQNLESNNLKILKNITIIAGLFHDLGKSSKAFQNMLKNNIDLDTLDINGKVISKKDEKYANHKWFNLIRHEVLSYLIIKDIILRNKLNDSKFFDFFSNKDNVIKSFEKTIKNIKIDSNDNNSIIVKFKCQIKEMIKYFNEEIQKNPKNILQENDINDYLTYFGDDKTNINSQFFKELTCFSPNFNNEKYFYNDGFLINCLLFLILTHHRLPENKIIKEENLKKELVKFSLHTYFNPKYLNFFEYYFDLNLTCHKEEEEKSNEWINLLTETCKNTKKLQNDTQKLFSEEKNEDKKSFLNFTINHAREALISSDYYQSKYKNIKDEKSKKIILNKNISFANIKTEDCFISSNGQITKKTVNKIGDTLTEHLYGVGFHCAKTFDSLFLSNEHISEETASIKKIVRDQFLKEQLNKKEKSPTRFLWQYDMVKKLNKEEFIDKPFFGVSVAGTGTGKTNANLLAMMTLSSNPRFNCALGLKTLTLQSYNAYKNFPELKSHTALFVGNSINKILDKNKEEKKHNGSDTQMAIESDYSYNHTIRTEEAKNTYNKIESLKNSNNWLSIYNDSELELIHTPIGVMTIDHIIKGVQYNKGHNMINLFRSTNSDLIIDEIDDYSLDDLLSIQKLVYFVGLSGRKVLISSATVNEVVVKSFFESYYNGIKEREILINKNLIINTGIISQFCDINFYGNINNIKKFSNNYDEFLLKLKNMIVKIDKSKKTQNNKTEIINLSKDGNHFQNIMDKINQYHIDNNTKINDNKFVSIGFTKFNNIKTSQNFCNHNFTFPEDTKVVFINYHSRFLEIDRFLRETFLDELLKREQKSNKPDSIENFPALMVNPITKNLIENSKEKNIIIVVSSTNILEVGRDHDYDWSIEEVQTIKSLNQANGRVRRHRTIDNCKINRGILGQHIKVLEDNKNESSIYEKGYEKVGILDHNKNFYNITKKKFIDIDKTSLNNSESIFFKGFDNIEEGKCLPPICTLKKSMISNLTNFDSLKLCSDNYSNNRLIKVEQLRYFEYFSLIVIKNNRKPIVNCLELENDFRFKMFGNHSKVFKFRKNKGGYDVNYNIKGINNNSKNILNISGFKDLIKEKNEEIKLKDIQGNEKELKVKLDKNFIKNKHLLDLNKEVVLRYLLDKIGKHNNENKLNFILFSLKIKEYQHSKEEFYNFKIGLFKE